MSYNNQNPPEYHGQQGQDQGQGQQNYSYDQGEYANQQGYKGQDAPPPINYNTKPDHNAGPKFEDQFKIEKPKWNDVYMIPVFLATLAGFVAVAVITIRSYTSFKSFQGGSIYSSGNDFSLNTNTVILFAFVVTVAVVVSIVYYTMARIFPRQFIIGTMIINLVIQYGTAIFYLVEKYWSAGVVFLVFALFSTWAFWTMRHRIPFASLVLKTIIDVTRIVPSVLAISVMGSLVAGAFGMLFSVTLVSVYARYDPNASNPQCQQDGNCSQAKLVGLIVFLTFAGFYISEVIKNVIHVSICGVYGAWYYCYKSDQGMPRWPAFGAFKRAMTYSFGSITLGSLVVALINCVRQAIQVAKTFNQQNGDNFAVTAALCFVDCLMWFIDWMVEFFNHYAYTYIALYGKAYIPAARDTWKLLKSKGIDAMINDCLINNVLGFASMFVGFLSALLAYLYLKFTKPAYNDGGGFYPIVIAFAFVIAGQIANITNTSLSSGVATFFVALAKDPDVLRHSYPEIYEQVLQTYPQVQEKLNL